MVRATGRAVSAKKSLPLSLDDDDEGREVLDLDPPDRLHAQLGVRHDLDVLDAVLRQRRRRPPIEPR